MNTPSRREIISGIPNLSALAWELAKSIRSQNKSLFVAVVPSGQVALDLRDDLNTLVPDIKTFYLPALENDFLRNRGASSYRRTERIRSFCRLAGVEETINNTRSLVLVPVEFYTQKSPSLLFWKNNSFRLSVGTPYDRDTLVARLTDFSYLPAELVEQPGQFASRGSIVDVFSPLYEHPLRFELFDDVIQSIRRFHPDSQRTIEDLQEAWVPPAREFLFPQTDEKKDASRKKIRELLDKADCPKELRETILGRFSQNSLFVSIDYWAPLLNPEIFTGPFTAPIDFFVEPHGLDLELKTTSRQNTKQMDAALLDGDWVPPSSTFIHNDNDCLLFFQNKLKTDDGLWLTTRGKTGLDFEPETKKVSLCKTLDSFTGKLASLRAQPHLSPFEELSSQIKRWQDEKYRCFFISPSPSQLERIAFLLTPHATSVEMTKSVVATENTTPLSPHAFGVTGQLQFGFIDEGLRLVFLLDEQVFGIKKKKSLSSHGSFQSKKNITNVFSDDFLLLDLKEKDLVVHKEHGIGRYLGMKAMTFGGIPSEFVEIEYKENSKLLVPVTRLNTVQKFSSSNDDFSLDKLGGQTWETKKSKAKRDLESIAGDLLHLYSQRELAKAEAIDPGENAIQEFAATFPYTETTDQLSAINACLGDMKKTRPMDRLVCGDVGYGKTEVAMRAAHAAVVAGYQVAILAPTTLLCVQHESTFKKRFAPLGYKVESLSRLKSSKDSKDIFSRLSTGETQIIIGTHKLLGKEASFHKLGLLVVDEEQRFGVLHKEKIKKLRTNVHVLSLSATPIPRTLNLALSGVKEISIISTPPQDRLSVRTHVVRKKPSLLQEAISSEVLRGGQVFYVHNRVQSMPKEFALLQSLLPSISIEWVHGQMDPDELEKKMLSFYEGRTQVLLTTAIIESGLDVPNANTMIVDRADMFGLAQLYQIRGRVGRASQRAHAYFLLPESANITQDAEERLAVLEAYQELGSGFHIASHDLEIRGSGDLLGKEQSGTIANIGFDAYMELLQECINDLKGVVEDTHFEPEINLGMNTVIPHDYVPENNLRLLFYRKLSASSNEHDVDELIQEMSDRFGPPPSSVENLAIAMRVKCQLRRLGVRQLNAGKGGFALSFDPKTPVNTSKIVASVKNYPNHFQLYPDGRLIIKRPHETRPGEGVSQEKILRGIEGALAQIESWC